MELLSREHPKVEQGGWFLLLCLEKHDWFTRGGP